MVRIGVGPELKIGITGSVEGGGSGWFDSIVPVCYCTKNNLTVVVEQNIRAVHSNTYQANSASKASTTCLLDKNEVLRLPCLLAYIYKQVLVSHRWQEDLHMPLGKQYKFFFLFYSILF